MQQQKTAIIKSAAHARYSTFLFILFPTFAGCSFIYKFLFALLCLLLFILSTKIQLWPSTYNVALFFLYLGRKHVLRLPERGCTLHWCMLPVACLFRKLTFAVLYFKRAGYSQYYFFLVISLLICRHQATCYYFCHSITFSFVVLLLF